MTETLKIGFAGTPEFAIPTLKALAQSRHELAVVYTQPDRRAGRGRKVKPSPVKAFALAHDIAVEQPPTLRESEAQATLQSYELDLLVVAAYGLILPRAVLSAPLMGCWNVHASLLPRWRGAAPIQRAIIAGDAETGVCIMQMDAGLDTGDILASHATLIDEHETAGELHDRLAELGAASLIKCLARRDSLKPQPQDDNLATYADKITKDEAKLSWAVGNEDLIRRIRAYNPFPGAQLTIAGDAVKIWEARPIDQSGEPGNILQDDEGRLIVAAGQGAVEIVTLQRPGGKRIPADAYLNGRSDLRA